MELPIDGEIAQAIDELIGPVAPQVDHLMGLLQQGAYLSDGPGSAICVGFALFVYKYGQHRTESDEIDVCLKAAFADLKVLLTTPFKGAANSVQPSNSATSVLV